MEEKNNDKTYTVYYDYQAFTHQKYGGVSKIFVELIRHLPPSIRPVMGVHYSDNIYLRDIYTKALPEDKRHSLWFKFCSQIAPRRFPYPKYANRSYCRSDIQQGKFDLLHATYFDTYVLDCCKRPFVITIHDMIDELTGGSQTVPKRKAQLAQKASHIIAVSEQTKKDIIDILHVPSEKITVIYHAASPMPQIPQTMPSLPSHYILYVGGRSRNYKNWPMFVHAVQPLLEEHANLQVLCIGSRFNKSEQTLLKQLHVDNRFISFFAEEDQLYTIYHHALFFVYPSRYEGFGLPILEAWQSECPILLSRSSCFPEIAGDAALYHEENNVSNMTNQMHQLLTNEGLRQEMIQKGLQRLKIYSWERSATQLADVYKKVLSEA